jgi:hypothetical protein
MLSKFWKFLEDNKTFHSGLTAALFLTQIVHLFWLFTHVILVKLTGYSPIEYSAFFNTLLALADYTEIPALISASLLYARELKSVFNQKSFWFLLLVNSQWLHLFWITDEVVFEQFTGSPALMLPVWLSWFAIAVDYFELPVIFDTSIQFIKGLRRGK